VPQDPNASAIAPLFPVLIDALFLGVARNSLFLSMHQDAGLLHFLEKEKENPPYEGIFKPS
jgi:hypothetical protein